MIITDHQTKIVQKRNEGILVEEAKWVVDFWIHIVEIRRAANKIRTYWGSDLGVSFNTEIVSNLDVASVLLLLSWVFICIWLGTKVSVLHISATRADRWILHDYRSVVDNLHAWLVSPRPRIWIILNAGLASGVVETGLRGWASELLYTPANS